MFLNYLNTNDFIGADMARKFLQMGYTRSRRYANHSSGKKYVTNPQKITDKETEALARRDILLQNQDWKSNQKALSAEIFKQKWDLARENQIYKKLTHEHKQKYSKPKT